MKRYTWIFVSVVGFLFFVASIVIAIQQSATARAAQHWQKTTGRILTSHVYHNGNGRRRDTYEPMGTYAFQVNGRAFTGGRIWLIDPEEWNEPQEAQAIVDRHFAVGQTVDVHYDPADPGNSALVLQQPDFNQWLFVGGFGLVVLAGGILFRRRMGATR